MITSAWNDQDAARYIDQYAPEHGEDVALRVYTSRLIGRDPSLVLHGGGNTSVKTTHTDILGRQRDALYVKGSGWDLANIEPPGFPALDLEELLTLRQLDTLSDEDMVRELRVRMFNPAAPNPSVETLLHGFIANRFIDHSHADAILTITNTANADELIAACFGDDVLLVPYIMPGFALSKLAADVYDTDPSKRGMILLKHGLFTFGDTARDSYEYHIELVQRAETFVEDQLAKAGVTVAVPALAMNSIDDTLAARALPILRGVLSRHAQIPFILERRYTPEIETFLESDRLDALSHTSPLTPDHVIRTKQFPCVLRVNAAMTDDVLTETIERALEAYSNDYAGYFARCQGERGTTHTSFDACPRVILMPGVGLITAGETTKATGIAGDLYEHTISVKRRVDAYTTYEALPELELFDVEYWSLEIAKLAGKKRKPLDGRVALITGGAGAVGRGIATTLRDAGANVVVADIQGASEAAADLGVRGITMDVTDTASVDAGLDDVVREFGGLDIVIPNAGIASSATIDTIDDDEMNRVFDINFAGYLRTMRAAARVMKRQSMGGHIAIISSKNVFAPGKEFALYSASKAAGHQVGRIAAMELAPFDIRVNMINPDGIFHHADIASGLWEAVGPERAKSRGLTMDELPDFYRQRNLLKAAVTAEHVGRAVLFVVSSGVPMTGATIPVDGGIPEASPR